MDYFLGIPIPTPYAERIEAFRRDHAMWALGSQRSEPHIGEPAFFEGESVLYLSVESPSWSKLNSILIDSIAAKTGAVMHPFEISGWIPHLTIVRLKPEALPRYQEIFSATAAALSPFPTFTAAILRMYRQELHEGPWLPFRDFALSN